MKKQETYEQAVLEIISFDAQDIITTSYTFSDNEGTPTNL